jgi:predicted HAD superfamily hydrolase
MNELNKELENITQNKNFANGIYEISIAKVMNHIRKNRTKKHKYRFNNIKTIEISCWRDLNFFYVNIKGEVTKYNSPWKVMSLYDKYKIFQSISNDIYIDKFEFEFEDECPEEKILFIYVQKLFNNATHNQNEQILNNNINYLNNEINKKKIKHREGVKLQIKLINAYSNINAIYKIINSEMPSNSFYEMAKITIKNNNYQLVTFDFFDTLIFRTTDNPKDIFIETAERMRLEGKLPSYITPLRYKNLRVEAEIEVRKKALNNECRLIEIYSELNQKIPTLDIVYAQNIEVQTEIDNAIINISVIKLAKLAIKYNKKIAIISDTYFSEQHIAKILGLDYQDLFSKIFTSSDYRTGKIDQLHSIAHKNLNINSNNVLHFGDNFISDIQKSQQTGASAILLPNGTNELLEIREREDKLIKSKLKFNTENTKSVFFAQQIKVSHHFNISEPWGHLAYGAYVLGPIYGAYANWAKEEISQNSFDYVFFVMREGYLLNEIFNIILGDKQITKKNIYISRKKLFSASLDDLNDNDLDFVFNSSHNVSLDAKLALLNLSIIDLPDNIKKLNDFELREYIIANSNIKKIIKERAEALRHKILLHLFGSRVINSKIRIALIDLGWNTTIQKLLNKCLMIEEVNSFITGYYLMTTNVADHNELPDKSVSYGYLVNAGNPVSFHRILSRNLEILEQCCNPPHGTVIDFESDGKPIVDCSPLPIKQVVEISYVQAGILKYIKYIQMTGADLNGNHAKEEVKQITRLKLIRAMMHPTAKEISLFIDWMHDDNLFNTATRNILYKYSPEEMGSQNISEIFDKSFHEIYWNSGSVAYYSQDLAEVRMYADLLNLNVTRLYLE